MSEDDSENATMRKGEEDSGNEMDVEKRVCACVQAFETEESTGLSRVNEVGVG
jgi:hypothetical protein